MAENNEKEIVVRGPSKPATPPEKKAEKDAERALEEERFGVLQISQKVGFYFKRQEGSHIILRRDDPFTQIVVPDHKELDRGTLRAIIRQTALSVDEFMKLL